MSKRKETSEIRVSRPALALDDITAQSSGLDAVPKAGLALGDRVIVTTRNSVYDLWSLGDGLFRVSGGWFDREHDRPSTIAVNGCTWGGRALYEEIVAAPGLFLEFANGVMTTRIQKVELVRSDERVVEN